MAETEDLSSIKLRKLLESHGGLVPCPQHNLAESICERHGTLAATGTMSLMFFCKMPKKSSLLYSINVVSLRAFTAEVP